MIDFFDTDGNLIKTFKRCFEVGGEYFFPKYNITMEEKDFVFFALRERVSKVTLTDNASKVCTFRLDGHIEGAECLVPETPVLAKEVPRQEYPKVKDLVELPYDVDLWDNAKGACEHPGVPSKDGVVVHTHPGSFLITVEYRDVEDNICRVPVRGNVMHPLTVNSVVEALAFGRPDGWPKAVPGPVPLRARGRVRPFKRHDLLLGRFTIAGG